MAGVHVLVQFYEGWGIHVLVLLSLAMQLTLFITAEIRRRKDSGALRFIVWSAYLAADSTAIYTLGHMSLTSRSSEQQQLMALWATFLLLHLGGQDNITAYALEDVHLWLRHLQLLVVQVVAAAYVLYQSSSVGSGSLLWHASILVFVVGVIKYGERVWALFCANAKGGNKNYGGFDGIDLREGYNLSPDVSTEDLLKKAHMTLTTAASFFNRPLEGKTFWYKWGDSPKNNENMFTLVEMQLSLMHDVFYSKADVIHTWYGILIRIISSASTAATLLLFHWSVLHSGGNRADVGVTYVLLSGAVVLEATSLLKAIFSIQVAANMKFLHPVVSPLRRLVLPERRRWWWSNSMGQHNLFKLLERINKSRSSRIARRMKVEEPWNTMLHSGRVPFSQKVKSLLVGLLYHYLVDYDDRKVVYTAFGTVGSKLEESKLELNECIVVWHIATEVYLRWYKNEEKPKDEEQRDLMEAIEVLSNYMLFLMAARPNMLPKSDKKSYSDLCYLLSTRKNMSTDTLVSSLHDYGSRKSKDDDFSPDGSPDRFSLIRLISRCDPLRNGSLLGAKLIGGEGLQGTPADNMINQIAHKLGPSAANSQEFVPAPRLKVVAFVWACMLFDASKSTNPDSHAKQLSNGGELLTVVAILMAHLQKMEDEESDFSESESIIADV